MTKAASGSATAATHYVVWKSTYASRAVKRPDKDNLRGPGDGVQSMPVMLKPLTISAER
jgi:hypothetical protein